MAFLTEEIVRGNLAVKWCKTNLKPKILKFSLNFFFSQKKGLKGFSKLFSPFTLNILDIPSAHRSSTLYLKLSLYALKAFNVRQNI